MLFSNFTMIIALYIISTLGVIVWAHHLYTTGMDNDTRAYYTSITSTISLPTGTKIFNWLCTYQCILGSYLYCYISLLCILVFLITFTTGGSTGVILGNVSLDIALHDTFYIVTHFHIILSLGTVIAIISGLYFLQPQFIGSTYRIISTLCTIIGIITCIQSIGVLMTFIPMHFIGFTTLPRRIPDFIDSHYIWNSISTCGSISTLISTLLTTR